uniref:Uncharacterized protein n=1 Tax=Corethron hystrix TaxID=216773 RepID=A0A7S1B5G1_9STRA|mmetsp:Transcript_13657/g.30131  ORF Transcript_13657/g.30131 Transcript_13657/m.30131 type:complete len:465 (+) Transcript_13657:217-1611(+)
MPPLLDSTRACNAPSPSVSSYGRKNSCYDPFPLQRVDSLNHLRFHIESIKDVVKTTEHLVVASRARIDELEDQKNEAEKEQERLKNKLAEPSTWSVSVVDMITFYKDKLKIPDESSQETIKKVQDLDLFIETVDEEIIKANRGDVILRRGLTQLKNDINSLEKSLENEKTQKGGIIAKYEQERKAILRRQEEEARESSRKVTDLCKQLAETLEKSQNFQLEHRDAVYEEKIVDLQTKLDSMKKSLSETQEELDQEIKKSEEKCATVEDKIATYERQLLALIRDIEQKEKSSIKKREVDERTLSVKDTEIEAIKVKIAEKSKELQKHIIVKNDCDDKTKELKKEILVKANVIEDQDKSISILEKEVGQLQDDISNKAKVAEEKLEELRSEMTRKLTLVLDKSANQLKESEEKVKAMRESSEASLAKKDQDIVRLRQERELLETRHEKEEHEAAIQLKKVRESHGI